MQQEYTNSQMVALIEEYIHSERDRKILKRRLIDGSATSRWRRNLTLRPGR